ncbi:Hypothetical predicted protein [Octopus vulgaris]|uniref:Uncharacterized protein n=2 Tax=Octopus TaxID=6643 RepID=A0AA36AFF8_OCTVU|nr:transmembrane protein 17B isoform X1 [Octopus sinensis]CAI9715150.1 Hypothetical predicted protein [Octopus vulgaris]
MASNVEATLRKTVSTMTDFLFPVSRESIKKNQHNVLRSGHEYVTSLPFQMELYFNVWFFPFWLVSAIAALAFKFSKLSIVYKILLVAAYVMFGIIEIIRLYLGYIGNLMERVPELAGSWLLTLLMQFPLIIFLLFNEGQKFPLEIAVHIVMFGFVLTEMFSGYFAIRTMINYQMTQFHLRQFSDLEFIIQD